MAAAAAFGLAVRTVTALAAAAGSGGLAPQAEGTFCTSVPTGIDARVATTVNAVGVFAPTTPPIAVLDTGSSEVTELAGRIASPFDALAGNDDGTDLDGHGTQIAAVAAAAPGLLQGVSPTSPIMPVRVYNRLGESSIQALTSGIAWAVSHGAAVINISSSVPAADVSAADTLALSDAITSAFNSGVLVVAAAGNDGTAQQDVPATLPHVLTVGASDFQDRRAVFSNTGPWVDLVAPASSLAAPVPVAYCQSGYAVANGTSFAAPAVAGAAALIAELRPQLSAQQRFDLLRSSARDLAPAGRDDETGFGMLNVAKALTAPPPPAGSSAEVDDDPVYVRGANAAGHPVLLGKRGKARLRLNGQVSATKDPADIYPVRLRKGERFVASATASAADAVLFLTLWKPAVGDHDVSRGITKQQVVSSGGFSRTPELKMRVTKGGTYFVSIEAPDVFDDDDAEAVAPVAQPYVLALSKSTLATKKPRTRKAAAGARSAAGLRRP